MNWWERQRRARTKTAWSMAFFGLAVVLTTLAPVALVGGLMWSIAAPLEAETWRSLLGAWGLLLLAVVAVTIKKHYDLRREGPEGLVKSIGGEVVNMHSPDPHDRRLLNVVEEIALAARIQVPTVMVLREEDSINALAAGHHVGNAVVAVTQGCLERLSRDELQGVIAHEFSHVVHGDMPMNMKLVSAIYGLTVIPTWGEWMCDAYRWRLGRSQASVGIVMMVGAVLWVLGSVGLLFARLFKALVNQSREHLADASAVQYTRMPSGLAGALKKAAGLEEGARIRHTNAAFVSHMWFADGGRWSRWWSSHPPILERIQELDPAFQVHRLEKLKHTWREHRPVGLQEDEQLMRLRSQDPTLHPKVSWETTEEGTGTTATKLPTWNGAPIRESAYRRDKAPWIMMAWIMDASQEKALLEKWVRPAMGDVGVEQVKPWIGWHTTMDHTEQWSVALIALRTMKDLPNGWMKTWRHALHGLMIDDHVHTLKETLLVHMLEKRLKEWLGSEPLSHPKNIEVMQSWSVMFKWMAEHQEWNYLRRQQFYHRCWDDVGRSAWAKYEDVTLDAGQIREHLMLLDRMSDAQKYLWSPLKDAWNRMEWNTPEAEWLAWTLVEDLL